MKKTFRTLLSSALVLALAACSYVPELPYPDPNDPSHGDEEGSLPFTSSSLKDGFSVQTIEGVAWSLGSTYAKASGYDNNTKVTTATKTWLVSPAINTTTDADTVVVKFDNVLRYVEAGTDVKGFHKVLASTDYAGDVTTATWTDLGFEPVESATQSWTFYAGKPVVLPEKFVNQEKVYLAFYFECTAENSTTWELQNLYVGEGSGGNGDKPVIEGEGDGTKANPYNVAAVQSGATGAAWVKGYIVGFIPGKAFAEAIFGCEGDTLVKSNIIIGATADASTTAEVIPVALPAGAIRNALAVAGNPALLGKEVAVHGNLVTYFGTTGVKDVDDYVLDGKGAATPDDAKPCSVADFITHQGDGNWYILTGAIDGLKDGDQYGNFDLVDETGSVYVYGVRSEYNGPKQKFQELVAQYGLKDGDVIKITAQSVDYQGTAEASDAFFVELVSSAQGETVTEVTIAEFNTKEEGDDWYKISGTVSGLTAGDSRGIFTLTDASGSVSVDGLAAAKGAANDQFQNLVSSKGIIDGCTLTIVGQHGDEDGVIINAYFVSITGGEEKPQPDGENLVSNGGFENWDGTTPVDWKSASTASSATLSQSTDAHSGSYSVSVGGDTSGKNNKRLACKEITLPAGKYAMSFYVKGVGATTGSVCPGFVPVTEGKVGTYSYGEYTNNIATDSWTKVDHTFELSAETTICVVVMNSKKSLCNVLVDDVTLVAAE